MPRGRGSQLYGLGWLRGRGWHLSLVGISNVVVVDAFIGAVGNVVVGVTFLARICCLVVAGTFLIQIGNVAVADILLGGTCHVVVADAFLGGLGRVGVFRCGRGLCSVFFLRKSRRKMGVCPYSSWTTFIRNSRFI